MEYVDYNSDRLFAEYRQLLLTLKTTAEGLFLSQVCNVWNVYGGLNRLHSAVEYIFKHGTRVYKPDGTPDCWLFVEGLNWLNPSLANSLSVLNEVENASNIPYSRIKNDKALTWLYRCLENHTLSQKLSWLISDKEHLASCFEKTAFLCQERYAEATLICLRAVERNQPSLITDVDPCLFLNRTGLKQFHKTHRRCSSFPEFVNYQKLDVTTPVTKIDQQTPEDQSENIDPIMGDLNSKLEVNYMQIAADNELNKDHMPRTTTAKCKKPKKHKIKHKYKKFDKRSKSWGSLPGLTDDAKFELNQRGRSSKITIPTQTSPLKPPDQGFTNVPVVDYGNILEEASSSSYDQIKPYFRSCIKVAQPSEVNTPSTSSAKKHVKIVHCDDIKIHTDDKYNHISNLNVTTELITQESMNLVLQSVEDDTINIKAKRPSQLNLRNRFNPFSSSSWEAESPTSLSKMKKNYKIPTLANSAPEFTFLPRHGEKIQHKIPKKTFIEDGGSSVLPMATGFFPRPTQGQSLMSFLTSAQFSRANAELDRENAHFSISEAMIAAIEQIKWNRLGQLTEEGDESDEEINSLKQRIRIRRRQRQEERNRIWSTQLLSDGKTDSAATTDSASPLSSSPSGASDSSIDLDASCGLSDSQGLSVSLGSLYSDGDLSRHSAYAEWGSGEGGSDHVLSAEGVALSLISKFSDKQLPRASDLQWLVSEADAPQRLLPLPGSWPVSPDTQPPPTPLRGTSEWAPPRPQVIFTPHPQPNRKQLLTHQHWRCAGCAMRVAEQYSHRFRYCEYLGRYHCTGCHNNQLALIPGRVLAKWDFTRCPVSNFSYRLLERMWADPLFRVGSVAPALYGRARPLARAKLLREKMVFLKESILSCRFAECFHKVLESEPSHLLSDPDVWSMSDFTRVKSGELNSHLKDLMNLCEGHVKSCELCQARGFVCEICTRGIIFPWQEKISRCAHCGSCYHMTCWNPAIQCRRCTRLNSRKQRT